jgi:hypothetical protein
MQQNNTAPQSFTMRLASDFTNRCDQGATHGIFVDTTRAFFIRYI